MATNETKSMQIFAGKVRELNRYLQLMDNALRIANNLCNERKTEEILIAEALGTTELKHNQLNVPNRGNDIKRTFISARNKLNEQALVELYSLFADYIANVIGELVKVEPLQLLPILNDNNRSIEFAKIIQLGTYETVLKEMSQQIFRSLENERSTKKMLDKLLKSCDLVVNDNLKNRVLLYLEIRHLIIHNNTKADERFKEMNTDQLIAIDGKNKIVLNYEVTSMAIVTVFEFCQAIDKELLVNNFVKERS